MISWQRSKQRLLSGMLAAIMLILSGMVMYVPEQAEAASKETVDLRFIFTTDLHGQLNNIDYESGKEYSIGSLSKAYTLIKQARSEKKSNNIFTFDVGDVLYDYSTEYIFSEDQKEVQPIYKGMAKVGYDAIILGNHDFDYGWDYILNQLSGSGLMDKVIVSNLTDIQTKEHIFHENMIINREALTSSGKKITVKVGIIGEAIPNLTSKTENYTDRLKMQDIVENTKSQAANLKKEGADVIVVLAHSGIGEEEPLPMDANVAYALTKIPEVDVVLCGHQHNQFPTANTNSAAYKLPGVDAKTGLVNGKNLIMSSDRGKSIGVADITIQVNGNGSDKTIVSRSSEVRNVKSSTPSDKTIADNYGDWEEKLYEYSKKTLGNIKAEDEITNFFGLVEDNTGLQLVNDAKRSFAHRYIYKTATKYKNYPVIAASFYNRYGENSYTDYVNISGNVTESALSSIQIYNNYIALYEINGKQLKEWLEWMASAFEVTGNKSGFIDSVMQGYISNKKLPSLISEDWINNWNGYRIFDGIEYTIDPKAKPRYDKIGNKINNTSRIVKLTYDGKTVTDTTKFVLATDRITKTVPAIEGLDKQYIVKGFNRTQSLLADYVEQLGKVGDIKPVADYNWRLSLNDNYQFIIKASKAADALAKKQSWYVSTLGTTGNYSYFVGQYGNTFIDSRGPGMVITPIVTETTSQSVPVIVDATDVSGVKSLKYNIGELEMDSSLWNIASEVKDGKITAYTNGIYTILAEDNNGNKSIGKVKIDNIKSGALQAPVVNNYTNRKSKITGTALANAAIYFETSKKTYEAKVDSQGNFSYALPSQASGTELNVYIKDEQGNQSDKRLVKVKRTGPNRPTVAEVSNNDGLITGKTNDNAASVLALVTNSDQKSVYISKDQIASYEASEIYNEDFMIVSTPVKVSASGKYSITLPAQLSGSKVTIYGIDHLNRVSRSRSATVLEKAPDSPIIFDVTNAEREISGQIPNVKKNVNYQVTVSYGGKEYEGTPDEKGFFTVPVNILEKGEEVSAFAIDDINGTSRKSYTASKEVESMDDYVTKNSGIILNSITNKGYEITGNYEAFESLYISAGRQVQVVETDVNGDFVISLDNRLTAGSKVYAFTRFTNGGIIAAQGVTVKADVPERPSIAQDEITNNTKEIHVLSEENCTINVTIGKEKYTSSKPSYDKENQLYLYLITIPRTNSGASVKITAKNKIGTSKTYSVTIKKAAPDVPFVDTIDTESEKITGEIELIAKDPDSSDDITVSTTKTSIYAKIGSKEYKGKINEDGTYTIKIPKQKKGTKIIVWGENHSGRGPQGSISVKEAKKDTKK